MKNELYLHYKSRVSEANHAADFDHIIESAFRDYINDNLNDTEYGKIYFACVDRQNKL